MHIFADIGGTKMRIAAGDDSDVNGEPLVFESPQLYTDGLMALKEGVNRVTGGANIENVVIGITGVIAKNVPVTAPHLEDWKGRPLADDVGAMLHAKQVHIENDTALVGLGEATRGAGKGANIVAYITVSTGVNGVRIVDGAIDRASQGFEVGGQYLSYETNTTFEDLVSGKAVLEKYGVAPQDIQQDSPIWNKLADITAYGVHNAILHWSPDRVVLGGAMFTAPGMSVTRVQDKVREIMRKFPSTPDIRGAELGDLGGLYGGLALVQEVIS